MLAPCRARARAQPTLFTIEGLLYYLPEEAVLSLLAHVGLLAATGSRVMLDIMHAAALEGRTRSDAGGFHYAGFKTTAQVRPGPPLAKHLAADPACPPPAGVGPFRRCEVHTRRSGTSRRPCLLHGSWSTAGAAAVAPPPEKNTQAVANKGEPYRFGIRDAPDAMAGLLAAAHRLSLQIHAAGASSSSASPPPKGLRLTQYLGPREMAEKHMSHLEWSDACPPLAAFYSYAAAEAM